MDFATALKPDIYRTTVVVLLPGALSTTPWLAFVFWPEILGAQQWKEAGIPTAVSILLISLIAGMILENLGSRFEVENIDKHCAKALGLEQERHAAIWRSYLGTRADRPLVAHRYLSSLLTRFKFELSMIPALGSVLLALLVSMVRGSGLEMFQTFSLIAMCGILIDFFVGEARLSGVQLHEVRLIILDAPDSK